MPSPFHGIDMASRALRSFQRGLDVTGHNIANVNTPGFSRQTVDFRQSDPTTFYARRPFELGSGVDIASVNRIRDIFLEKQRMGVQSDLGRAGTMAQGLKQIEGVYHEPGPTGVSDALSKFFDAWSGLASNPSDPAARSLVRMAGQTLTDRIRGVYSNLQALDAQHTASVDSTIESVNRLSHRVSELNQQIRQRLNLGAQPNDLLDQRDLALQELSKLVDIKTQPFGDGSIVVYVNQFTLIDPNGANPLPSQWDAATQTLTNGTESISIRGGVLNGLLGSLNAVRSNMGQLDLLANTLRSEINALHQTGTNQLGTTGINFFNDATPPAPQTGAIDFRLSADVLASADAISSGVSGNPGDGGLALALAGFRESSVAGLGGKSFRAFYTNFITSLAHDVAFYETSRDTFEAVLNQVDAQRQSISGVSLDDEMANMLRFQRSYQAAAKALTIFDQVTEDLINMLRR
jgi:flagellar hook-associated protein 1